MQDNIYNTADLRANASGNVCWESPSNIALVKYWGKRPGQVPMNPSISFVLRESVVRIAMEYSYNTNKRFRLESFNLNGMPDQGFFRRIEQFLKEMAAHLPFLEHTSIQIDSRSTFPHSAGIASSAAAFSAMALCLCTIESHILGRSATAEADFYRRASFIARLGSGSACRSVYNGMVLWGGYDKIPASSNMHAIRLDDARIHPVFMTLRDAVLIIDDGKKAISSSAGHALMHAHPYKKERINQAHDNLGKLLLALAGGNTGLFAEVVENEALSLHSLMMSSNPGYVLIKPNTLVAMDKIQAFRKNTNIDLCFTLDAGPNIHLLYFEKDQEAVKAFISNELESLCIDNRWIDDAMGTGPEHIKQ